MIIDYEKLHKDTINKLQQMVNSGKITAETARGICADFVPESEDERTWIINYLSNRILNSTIIAEKENLKKAIAWLEKQGEQKHVIAPKFDIGDTIRNKITNEVFTITDRCISLEYYHDINHLHEVKFSEQDDWELVLQNPDWSEEDERMIEAIEALCDDKIRFTEFQDVKEHAYTVKNWLKSLKDKYTWKPSDEQMLALNIAIEMEDGDILKSLYNDLKKLKR